MVNKKSQKRQDEAVFPFTAIIGQEEMKLALILNVVDPTIGGLIIMGDRGTGKSTTVRAIADLLPDIEVIKSDPFNSALNDTEVIQSSDKQNRFENNNTLNTKIVSKKVPLVDLPLGATEDRLCGTIDIEKALSDGRKGFEPGLLAKANRGLLYVDEVNLLDDHLIDVLLDAAASGWNIVEREGISIKHPSRFVLIGSGNPEEGELRPQLLDRFGMSVEIRTAKDPTTRVKIVDKRSNFDENPLQYLENNRRLLNTVRRKIIHAQKILDRVTISMEFKIKIAEVCGLLNVDGVRGDIVINRAAKASAALGARTEVNFEDLALVIPLCLRHRLRKDPLKMIGSDEKIGLALAFIFEEEARNSELWD